MMENKYQEALEFIRSDNVTAWGNENIDKMHECIKVLQELVDKATPKFVLCPKGFQGIRYTRYYCPNCEKIVKNGDEHCHRCGQNIKFPKIKFSNNKAYLDWNDEND